MAFRGRAKTISRKNRTEEQARGSWFELVVLIFMLGSLYVIGALMGGAWTGSQGRLIGESLRTTWGGALIIPLLFLVYLCAVWFAKRRIPRPLGQIVGTLQLYLTTAFVLGLVQEMQFQLPWVWTTPGSVGSGIARFFTLNLGVLGAIIVALASFALASILFGFKLPVHVFQSIASRSADRTDRTDRADKREREEYETREDTEENLRTSRSEVNIRTLPRTGVKDLFAEPNELSAPRTDLFATGDEIISPLESKQSEPMRDEHEEDSKDEKNGKSGKKLTPESAKILDDFMASSKVLDDFKMTSSVLTESKNNLFSAKSKPSRRGFVLEPEAIWDNIQPATPSLVIVTEPKPVAAEHELKQENTRRPAANWDDFSASPMVFTEPKPTLVTSGSKAVKREEPKRRITPTPDPAWDDFKTSSKILDDFKIPTVPESKNALVAYKKPQTAVEILNELLASIKSDEPLLDKKDDDLPATARAYVPSASGETRRISQSELDDIYPLSSPTSQPVKVAQEELEQEETPPQPPRFSHSHSHISASDAHGVHLDEQFKNASPAAPSDIFHGASSNISSAVGFSPTANAAPAVQEAFPEVDLPEDDGMSSFSDGLFPPPLDIFGPPVKDEEHDDTHELAEQQAVTIVETLQNFGVKSKVANIVIGPSVIQFQLELAPGIKVSKVTGLANDLTMALAVLSVRVEAPILGQRYVGIEIPNPKRKGITLRSIMESEEFQGGNYILPLPMGVRVDSEYMVCGLEDMPHLLVAGTTGSGKSVFTNTCILGMCSQRGPEELKLILVDPKHVEFAIYEGLPHLLARPISEPKKAISALSWAVQEMETRSEVFAKTKVRNLASYNEKVLPKNRFPHIVVVVDELADLMYTAGREVEGLIARLAQKARAAGIHLILATQRPSVDVVTGLIKANVPARVAFALPSQTDSRTIIDTGGAEKLLGKGDMLFYSTRYPRPLRLQAGFVTEERTLEFVEYMKNVFGEPEYIEFNDFAGGNGASNGERSGSSIVDDPKMDEAIKVVMDTGIASASGLQRYLNIGYPRAGRLISGLEQLGIVGPQTSNSSKPRDILVDEESAMDILERARSGEDPE